MHRLALYRPQAAPLTEGGIRARIELDQTRKEPNSEKGRHRRRKKEGGMVSLTCGSCRSAIGAARARRLGRRREGRRVRAVRLGCPLGFLSLVCAGGKEGADLGLQAKRERREFFSFYFLFLIFQTLFQNFNLMKNFILLSFHEHKNTY